MPGLEIDLVTTEPAPITVLSQILTGSMVAFDPIETLLPILDESIKLLNTEVQKNYPYSGFSKN